MDWYDDFEFSSPDIGADFEQMPELNSFDFSNFANPADFASLPEMLGGFDLAAEDTNIGDLMNYFSQSPDAGFNINEFVDSIGGDGNADWENYGFFESGSGKEPTIYDPNVQGTTTDPYKNFQTVGSDRIQIQDDGSAVLVNENGEVSYLTEDEVNRMNANKLTNTYESGYNTMTGGDKYAPGGGSTVTNANGSKTITMPGGTKYLQDTAGNYTKISDGPTTTPKGGIADTLKNAITGGTNAAGQKSGMDPMMLMMMLLMLSQANKGSGSSSQASTIPALSASRSQLPYTKPSRPGAGGVNYFSPTTYAPRMAGGGMAMAGGGGISDLGGYSDGGRLLKGPGDGVSDDIPATIAGKQPARLADGEFVVPARIVSELGNGSTDAGADKLYAMMDRIQNARRKTKNVAADTKASKHLPA